MLGHLLLLHHLAEGSTVTGAVLADDPWWVMGREWDDAVSVCVCMGSMDERAKSLGRIQPPVRSWLGGYISPRMARGMTRLVPRDALDDGTTRSRRGRCDHARRIRPDRAPARPASRVSRRHLTRRSAKSMGWNPKNPMVRGCVGGHGRSTAAVLTDFLSALSHPVESNAKGNARRPLATPSVPVEEGYTALDGRGI